MAPTKKVKTYNRSSSNINSSVDAFNLLFAKNITQRIISKNKIGKKKVIVKELPKRTEQYLLSDDSLQISTEDTFDKLRKGSSCSKLKEVSFDISALKTKVSVLQNSNISKKYTSLNVTDFSPITTRNRRKFTNSVRNRTDSLLERFKEPTMEILNSIEIETYKKTNNSSSYIKLPIKNQKGSNISCNNMTNTTNDYSRMEESFTKIFFQNQPDYCSTPVPNLKKQLSTAQLIIPLLKESLGEIKSWEHEFPIIKETDRASTYTVEDSQDTNSDSVHFINLRGRRIMRSNNSETKSYSKSGSIPSRTYSLDNFNAFEKSVNSIYNSLSKDENLTNSDYILPKDITTKIGSWNSNLSNNVNKCNESENPQKVIINLTNNIESFENFYQNHYSEVSQDLTNCSNHNKTSSNRKDLIVNITRQEERFEEFYSKHHTPIEADIYSRRESETEIIQNLVSELIINVTRSNLDILNFSNNGNDDTATYTSSIEHITAESLVSTNSNYNNKPSTVSTKDSDICDIKSDHILIDECSELDTFIIESSLNDSAHTHLRSYQTKNKCTNKFKSHESSSKKEESEQQVSVVTPLTQQSSIIDLTDSLDELSRFSKTPLKSSDIIESSICETNNREESNFKVPQVPNKNLVLKPGKLWRRSLLMYKRSNFLPEITRDICSAGPGCRCKSCNRRSSIKIVPSEKSISKPNRRTSILEEYALNASYVPEQQILEENLENSIGSLSLIEERSHILDVPPPITARDVVLRKCGQIDVINFQECYPESLLRNCQKIGEGVYGEVFLLKNPNGGTSVIKIIPIEGNLIVNGERQKKFDEIMSEIIIATELSNLRFKKTNSTNAFNEVQQVKCVQGSYPPRLLDLWDLFEEVQGSENDCPEIFPSNQLFIILQLANGGKDLESFVFNNAKQAYSMFEQVALALAVAESELGFEHRDLHWGNILLTTVEKTKSVVYKLNGQTFEIPTGGVEVAIIDFTLSRIEYDSVVMFNDLAMDDELFTGDGDYQFEIYRMMKKKNGNNWQIFEPYSNVLWLHYILEKAISALRYKYTQSKVHKEFTAKMKNLYDEILNYKSVKDFVLSYIVTK